MRRPRVRRLIALLVLAVCTTLGSGPANAAISFWDDSPIATRGAGGGLHRTWNQFQAGTKGQFASRAETATAWRAYKDANGIVTGATRSSSARGAYLRELGESGRAPSWMNQWLQRGRVPPGHQVDHIKPLSIGGADHPPNMRLLDKATHDMHHRYYRPWE